MVDRPEGTPSLAVGPEIKKRLRDALSGVAMRCRRPRDGDAGSGAACCIWACNVATSYLALQPFVSLGLLDNSLPTISILCLLPPSCHF
jgi:hypothetical protein